MIFVQHWFICRLSHLTMSEDAGFPDMENIVYSLSKKIVSEEENIGTKNGEFFKADTESVLKVSKKP